MLFPWVGLLEQVRLADVFVHYDDVQFSKGSFVNRVQLKFPEGCRWMTVPLKDFHFGQRIDELQPNDARDWRRQHIVMLSRSLDGTPYKDDAIGLAEEIYKGRYADIGELSRASLMILAKYFNLTSGRRFVDVRELDIQGSSTNRVLAVVERLGGNVYITGHGARKYLDHAAFEHAGVEVRYMQYRCLPYPQLHGEFTPYVSALDLVANCGRDGAHYIQSSTVEWRKFVDKPA